ncbi:MAG TPA: MBL fold metallo-hydrolase [Candidatus Paceibacterota bacterium]
MVINWYGEGCFKVQTGGLALLTDPFESSTGLTPSRGKVDVILKTLTPYPVPPAETSDEHIVWGGGEYAIKGIEIKGIGLNKESEEKYFKTAYTVKAEDITLGFLGHISESPDPSVLDTLKEIDILFIPAGGKPFIEIDAATKLIKQIEPKIIVAAFFKIPGLKRSGEDYKDLAKELGQKSEPEEKLTIRKKEITEQKGIRLVILKV